MTLGPRPSASTCLLHNKQQTTATSNNRSVIFSRRAAAAALTRARTRAARALPHRHRRQHNTQARMRSPRSCRIPRSAGLLCPSTAFFFSLGLGRKKARRRPSPLHTPRLSPVCAVRPLVRRPKKASSTLNRAGTASPRRTARTLLCRKEQVALSRPRSQAPRSPHGPRSRPRIALVAMALQGADRYEFVSAGGRPFGSPLCVCASRGLSLSLASRCLTARSPCPHYYL